MWWFVFFFFQAEDGIRDRSPSRGLGDVYKRQVQDHPERNVIRVQLAQNTVLQGITAEQSAELESHLVILDCQKGDCLLNQGVYEMEQYFILDGILKRVV